MQKIKNPWLKLEGYNCFGCAPDNPLGLHMEFFEDKDEIISFWNPREHYQSWVGTIHGGILATLIDETAGWVISRKMQTAGMTSRLELQYKKPVTTDNQQLTIRGHITQQKRNFVTIALSIENDEGETCVEATALYYAMDEKRAAEMGFTHCNVEDDQLFSM